MILFSEDWQRYPTAIVDVKTSNQSFVRLAAVYRDMGVRNHAFLLALVNPRLQGVNPYDPNLTREQKDMIVVECKMNPWYYFREVARIPGGSGEEAIPIIANRGNIALWWCFFNHIMITLIQPRQTGKSITTDELMVYLMGVVLGNTLVVMLTKDEKLRKENVQRIKNIFAELPPYLNQRNPKRDVNNSEEIGVGSLQNRYVTLLPQASEKAALNVGRGFTSPINHVDEGPFCVNIDISLPAMLSSGNAARDRAARVGAPYGTILTTTAGKRDEKEGAFIYKILMESMVWTEKVFDAENHADLEKIIRRSSRSDDNKDGFFQINATFSHRQLGYTDEWLHRAMASTKSEGDAAERDYMNVWTSGTQNHPLSVELLKKITASKDGNPHTDFNNPERYLLRWYVDEEYLDKYMEENKVILGVDTSDAVGKDDIGLVFTDARTLDVVGAANINETNILSFSMFLVNLLVKYQNITMVMERRSSGASIMDIMIKLLLERGEDPFKRMYNRVVQEFEENRERFMEIRQPVGRRNMEVYTQYKSSFGFSTSGSGVNARNELYGNTLQNAAKRGCDRVKDSVLISQIAGLQTRGGRIDHAVKGHDDMVVAWLLCNWFLTNGINLAHYGITQVMTDVATTQNKVYTPEEYGLMIQQQLIQDKIDKLAQQLTEEVDEYVCISLEHQLRTLARGLSYENAQLNSVDQLINNIKENKKANRRSRQYGESHHSYNEDDYYQNLRKFSKNFNRF
jgi:hypothetical protein